MSLLKLINGILWYKTRKFRPPQQLSSKLSSFTMDVFNTLESIVYSYLLNNGKWIKETAVNNDYFKEFATEVANAIRDLHNDNEELHYFNSKVKKINDEDFVWYGVLYINYSDPIFELIPFFKIMDMKQYKVMEQINEIVSIDDLIFYVDYIELFCDTLKQRNGWKYGPFRYPESESVGQVLKEYFYCLDWDYVVGSSDLINFIDDELLDMSSRSINDYVWDVLIQNNILTEKHFRKYINLIDPYTISVWGKLSTEFIEKYKYKLEWSSLAGSQKNIPERLIEEFKDEVDWTDVSECQPLSEDFIRKFKDHVCWWTVSEMQKLSEDFIREFEEQVDWNQISHSQTLSENFIREYKSKIGWIEISYSQTLSESFIREFKNEVYWPYISTRQKLSKRFIDEFKDYIDWDKLSENEQLGYEVFRHYLDILVPNMKLKQLIQKEHIKITLMKVDSCSDPGVASLICDYIYK